MRPVSDDSKPLAGLPAADRTLLEKPPLNLAIAEVRYLAGHSAIDGEAGLNLRDLLKERGWLFARFDGIQEHRMTLSVEPGATPTQAMDVVSGWQMITPDGATSLTIMPASLVVQTTAYERWSVSLRPLLDVALWAVEQVLAPSLHSRIGLRYVNRFVDAQAATPSAWKGRIHPALMGATCHEVFAANVRGAHQQLELALEATTGAILRHGPFVDPAVGNAMSYLLDIDAYDTATERFLVPEIVERAEILNRTIASLFQAAVTPEYLVELQGKVGAQTRATGQDSSVPLPQEPPGLS
jgi:uncharacterized protein (TIGR04255 family)